MPSIVGALNAGFRITVPYYIIEGFEIEGPPITTGNSHHGITLTPGATGSVIRMNSMHDLGRTVCSTTSVNTGMTFHGVANVVIERNRFYTIGRLRPGENGCVASLVDHDHGIYAGQNPNLTIRYNVFYDINRGYPIHIYKEGGCTNIGLFIYNNVFADRSPTNRPPGQILLAHSLTNVHINNNIFYDPPKGYGLDFYHVGPVENVTVSHNLTNGTASVMINPSGKPSSGLTYEDNMFNTDPGFINAEARDFALTSKSAALDRGTNVGMPFKGKAPDIGAFEFSEQEGNSPFRPEGLQIR
ncbi:MAG: right-handed parallel beta-helix repeat-containing protein [Nitrospira sp.]